MFARDSIPYRIKRCFLVTGPRGGGPARGVGWRGGKKWKPKNIFCSQAQQMYEFKENEWAVTVLVNFLDEGWSLAEFVHTFCFPHYYRLEISKKRFLWYYFERFIIITEPLYNYTCNNLAIMQCDCLKKKSPAFGENSQSLSRQLDARRNTLVRSDATTSSFL